MCHVASVSARFYVIIDSLREISIMAGKKPGKRETDIQKWI